MASVRMHFESDIITTWIVHKIVSLTSNNVLERLHCLVNVERITLVIVIKVVSANFSLIMQSPSG